MQGYIGFVLKTRMKGYGRQILLEQENGMISVSQENTIILFE